MNMLNGLDELRRRVDAISSPQQVPLSELFSSDFMSEHSTFTTFEQMVNESPFAVKSAEDFKAIPSADWNSYVQHSTTFASWQDMIKDAGIRWMKKRLFD